MYYNKLIVGLLVNLRVFVVKGLSSKEMGTAIWLQTLDMDVLLSNQPWVNAWIYIFFSSDR